MSDSKNMDYLHKEYPKQFKKDDFWSQIKRTVNGKPVSEENIQIIVDHIHNVLALNKNDHLLDLGCGNGALAGRLFDSLNRYTGVDFSEYLIEVAKEYFMPDSSIEYFVDDVRHFVKVTKPADSINKILMYGCVSYLSRQDLGALLKDVSDRYNNVSHMLIGNVPDSAKAEYFFSLRNIENYELNNPQTPIGVWWSQDEIRDLCSQFGFLVDILHMPEDFYGAGYRFDVLLKRAV